MLLLITTYEGGINFNPPASVKQLDRYNAKMVALQEKYQKIYELFGGDKAPDLTQPEIRRPIISCLKRSLNMLKKDVLYQESCLKMKMFPDRPYFNSSNRPMENIIWAIACLGEVVGVYRTVRYVRPYELTV